MSFFHHVVMSRFLRLWLLSFLIFFVLLGKSQKETLEVQVGIVLDTNVTLADLSLQAINMSLSEFYNTNNNFKTRIVLNIRDSKQTVVGAAASALYLIKKRKVASIIGPGNSMQAPFLINLGNQSQVPIISFSATSPFLDSLRSPYFIRATHDDSSQVHAISAIIETFKWREVVAIYVDNEFGDGILPYLVDAFQEINVRIRYRSAISTHSSDDQIKEELYRLMTMPTRVFVVHMLPDLGERLFSIAKEIGMMSKGYVWIVTNGIADLLSLMKESSFEDMHGVIGVKTYFSRSNELTYLKARWRKRFGGEELNNLYCWAYDAATALAMSIEEIKNVKMSFISTKNITRDDIGTDLDDLDVSLFGPKLLQALSTVDFKGVSGRFHLSQGELQAKTFKIINIEESGERTVGFWKSKLGLVKNLNLDQKNITIPHSSRRLRLIIWPGDTISVPKGWEIPTNSKKLRIAVPKKDGFNNFVEITKDANTNVPTFTGFCIDVFDSVMRQMPYAVPYEYISFETKDGKSRGSYDEMVYSVFLGEFDGVVGDTTILANRSTYVDFALPYSETGIVFVVPVKDEKQKGKWVFLKPLTMELWLLTAAAFVYVGIMVWIFEYQANEDFQTQNIRDKVSDILYFSFSTLFFAQRKPSESFFTRALVVVWCFVLLILTQSYTATLTSMLTVQELRPTVKHIDDLLKSNEKVGYQEGSFTFQRLKQLGFEESRLKIYNSPQEMRELFLNKSNNGGIGAAFDEVPYVKLFMAQYCSEYSIIEDYKADGFGFAFPLGSPLVSDISRQILNLTEGDTMKAIENKWSLVEKQCLDSTTSNSTIQLDHHSFEALFLIVFVLSIILLLFMLAFKRYQGRQGNEIQAQDQDNPPTDGSHGQANAQDSQTPNVDLVAREEVNENSNVAGRDEANGNVHHIVEVKEEGTVGVGDRDEANNHIAEVEPRLVQLQDQQPPAGLFNRRRKKPISKPIIPLQKDALSSRMIST